jgi:tetratricopeptide (TPR) repeat protein
MAFSLDLAEAEARRIFSDPSLLIFIDGMSWVPVEITMVKEGFTKAWRIGAKEWRDNVKTGQARFYPMSEAWMQYSPAAVPNVNPRFTLPSDVEVTKQFDREINRFVAREIGPQKETLLAQFDEDTPAKKNSMGILYGRYALLKEAWSEFSKAAEEGYSHAWTNLGKIAFLQKDYELALGYYKWAYKLDPSDSSAVLGIARSYYELEKLQESET